ncbi:MAG: hypothetical protein S4CHLAM2_13570 [Chlamydiales bacterium]|nr:hypothetical protein [Chlamydiales bacterium]
MSEHFHEVYDGGESSRHFHHVIALHNEPDLEWEKLSQQIPLLPRGWFELSRLPVEDRIEFTREFWLAKIPFISPNESHLEERLYTFFESLDTIEIFATQERPDQLLDVHMVYSLKEAAGFFHGSPPATESALDSLIKQFAHVHLPPDYLAFLQVHDGFCKYTDTGVLKSRHMARTFQHLQHLLIEEVLVRPDGQVIDPSSLIPFYESFGLHCYQCFYADWHPEKEMGNLYFSENDRTLSNFLDRTRLEENLAFSTFLAWLVFYLEDIWHI